MERRERLDKIRRLTSELVESEWDEVYVALSTFGLGVDHPANFTGTLREYVAKALLDASDGSIAELDDYYFESPALDSSPVVANLETPSPWVDHRFRLFLSHAYEHRDEATHLKRTLAIFGVDSFVAHADIDPSAEWLAVIEHALGTCDALLALLTDGFRESRWCDQEVGYAVAHGKVLIPARFDQREPHGFLARKQALTLSSDAEPPRRNARRVIDTLLASRPATTARLVDAMVRRVVHATSWDTTNLLLPVLRTHVEKVTPAHVAMLEEAQRTNVDVSNAFQAHIIGFLREEIAARDES